MKKILALLLIFALSAQVSVSAALFDSYINMALSEGIVCGDENGEFFENKPATRAEFAQMAARFLGLSGGANIFSDVKSSDWFYEPVSALYENGIISGCENAEFKPLDFIKCEDAVTVLGRFYGVYAFSTHKSGASDYAEKYFVYAVNNELLQEGGTSFSDPFHYITKGELSALLYKYEKRCGNVLRFEKGYPKISENGVLNNISIKIKTNMPCKIYYDLCKEGKKIYSANNFLCEITDEKSVVTANIIANINTVYDVYLRAVSPIGMQSKIVILNNVMPFAFSKGDGSEESPYIIYSLRQLSEIGEKPNMYYRLGADIVIDNDEWKSIKSFSGTLDGNGFEISGINISDGDSAGLFSVIDGGVVKNLTVSANINSKRNVGIIAGQNCGRIENCSVYGEVTAKTNCAGGICGINNGTIINCLSAAYNVSAGSYAGGISGQNGGVITNCLSCVDTVSADMYAGGISGQNSGEIKLCVCADMNLLNNMTEDGGRITTNKRDGITEYNYCYNNMLCRQTEQVGELTENGADISWQRLMESDFYKELGWDMSKWHSPSNGFRFICPAGTKNPTLTEGKTIYRPLAVSDAKGLSDIGKNESGHYILTKNITVTTPWKAICTKAGFTGSLDGNGFSVSGLNIKDESGMFSNITGGTVRNIIIDNAKATPSSNGAILAACSYGVIENCVIRGSIETKKAAAVGGIICDNFGEIRGCEGYVTIKDNHNNTIIGGLCANNSGIISGSLYKGNITAGGDNVFAGGIAGYSDNGLILENFSDAQIILKSKTAYTGGICGTSSETQVYKCSSKGPITAICNKLYCGGVCGMQQGGSVYNCFSASDLQLSSENTFSGGVAGFGSETIIQNTYSCGSVSVTGTKDIYAGGICGFAENSFVMQNAAINPSINAMYNAFAVIGGTDSSEISDNYSCERMLINSVKITPQINNGELKSLSLFKKPEFYFKPVAQGGLLGWECDNFGGDVWRYTPKNSRYSFPTHIGVKGQNTFNMPIYK